MGFKELFIERRSVDFLRDCVDEGRIAHAQLIEGEGGYGVFALAIAYIQYINCNHRVDGDSCGVCPSCKKIATLQHPDVHFVFPVNKSDLAQNQSKNSPTLSDNLISAFRDYVVNSEPYGYISPQGWLSAMQLSSKTLQPIINKKEADSIIDKLTLRAVEGRYKVVVIWLPETMNEAAANTLLKQFEEPTGDVLFLFVSQQPERIIKTILSRVQTIVVPPVPQDVMSQFVARRFVGLSAEQQHKIVSVAKGNILRAIESVESTADSEQWFEMFKGLMRNCFQNRHLKLLEWVDEFAALSSEEVDTFFANSIDVLRYSYLKGVGMEQLNTSFSQEREFIEKFFPFISGANIEQLIVNFQEAKFHLARNGNQKIVMTHFALSTTKLINPLKK